MLRGRLRLQFDFSPEAVVSLDELTERIDSASRAETVRRAVACFKLLVDRLSDGGHLFIEHGDKREEVALVIPRRRKNNNGG